MKNSFVSSAQDWKVFETCVDQFHHVFLHNSFNQWQLIINTIVSKLIKGIKAKEIYQKIKRIKKNLIQYLLEF